jgi:hypothetical protein
VLERFKASRGRPQAAPDTIHALLMGRKSSPGARERVT